MTTEEVASKEFEKVGDDKLFPNHTDKDIWVSGFVAGYESKISRFETEIILCSAIWYKDIPQKKIFDSNVLPVNCDRGLVFCGLRHTHCMYTMCSVTGLRSVTNGEDGVGEYEQGFLTSKNRFVNRVEGLEIAIRENQLKDPGARLYLTQLHSEDLY